MTTNNHPAHGPVSLDRLHQIHETLSKASAQSDGGNLGYAMADAVKVIDVAIAAFGAEPLAWFRYCSDGTIDGPLLNYQIDDCRKSTWTPLYAAPQLPQPVPGVPDEMYWHDEPVEGSTRAAAYATGWNACRAAMLQAGNSPATPDGYVLVPVELTQDMRAAWDSAPHTDDDDNDMQAAYRAMIAAAPQQEVK
ncbi:hypothetical protein R1Z32_001378 [Citrobacter freundii]|nr:hypothetical protein [Citrobacter freundii]